MRSPWLVHHAVATLVMMALGVAVTFDAWVDIAHIAIRDEEASHVLLVPLVFAWLVWVRRRRFRLCRIRHTWIGPVVIALGAIVATVGYGNAIQSFWHGGSVLVVVGCALSVLGGDVLRKFLPAFAVLVFLVPIPASVRLPIAMHLQTASAAVTDWTFQLLGANSERFGNVLSINGEQVKIIEACNGMRMVFTLAMVSYAYAFGTSLRPSVRGLVIAVSPALAIVLNAVRLVPTVWLYGYASHGLAEEFHDIAGWVMVFMAFILLMGLLHLMRWLLIPVAPFALAHES